MSAATMELYSSNGSLPAPAPYLSRLNTRPIATSTPPVSGTPRSPYGALSPTSTHGTLPPASPYSATQWAGAPSRGGSLSASGGLGTDDAAAVAAASSARQDAYFSELLTYSLERLAKEPELLKEDQKQLRRQQQETAVSHYRGFIQSAAGLDAVYSELEAASAALDKLLADVPSLEVIAEEFVQSAGKAALARQRNKQLHSNHGAVLELLELPALMDTCVRNGNYDEALDLRAFATKLAFSHSELPVVARLLEEVDAAAAGLLEVLLAKLRGSVQLPECLRIIGYLRRLAAFSEQELRTRFLCCREEWHAELVAELETSNAYDYLKRLTDVYRLHLFDVVMQYRAIFSDDSSAQEQQSKDGGILYSWAELRVGFYLEALQRHLPRVAEGGSLASVLEHCMYCGMSLARVGLDFRGLLPPLFEAAIANVFDKAVATAVDTFVVMLETHRWVASSSLASRSRRTDDSSSGDAPVGKDDSTAPPVALMEHPPLAVFANGILTALNELRHCAPLTLRQPLASHLQEALFRVAAVLAHYGVTRSLSDSQQPLFAGTCRATTKILAPYVAASFGRVYPGGMPLLDVTAANQPLLELMSSWEAPPTLPLTSKTTALKSEGAPTVIAETREPSLNPEAPVSITDPPASS